MIDEADLTNAWADATIDAALQGHGFIRISHTGTGFEAVHIKLSEYESIAELMKFIKDNKH